MKIQYSSRYFVPLCFLLTVTLNTPAINLDGKLQDLKLVINEIDYDQPETDTAEFIEIMNSGDDTVDLVTYALVLVNGSGGGASIYQTIYLPSVGLPPGEYYVVCANSSTVVNCDLDVNPDISLIQNGPADAVALISGTTMIDTVSYEGDTVSPYTEGTGANLEDPPDIADIGISRCPDGNDSDQNNLDFIDTDISPGAINLCYEFSLYIPIVIR